MKFIQSLLNRGPGIAVVAALLIALASFMLFSMVGQPRATPSTASTPHPALVISTTATTVLNPLPSVIPTVVPLASSATPTRTPLPTRPPVPLPPTPGPTFTRAPPTPVQPITAWLTYTNTTYNYSISYPNTWNLEARDPIAIFITTSPLPPVGVTSIIRSGGVKIDVMVSSVSCCDPPATPPQNFCVADQCGIRLDFRGPFPEQVKGLNRASIIQFQKGTKFYILAPAIQDPPADADRNAALVERIIASFRFNR